MCVRQSLSVCFFLYVLATHYKWVGKKWWCFQSLDLLEYLAISTLAKTCVSVMVTQNINRYMPVACMYVYTGMDNEKSHFWINVEQFEIKLNFCIISITRIPSNFLYLRGCININCNDDQNRTLWIRENKYQLHSELKQIYFLCFQKQMFKCYCYCYVFGWVFQWKQRY